MFKSLFLFAGLLFATSAAVVLDVDTNLSQVTWKGYKVTGSHEGTIDIKKGNLEFTDGVLTGGSFTMDMPSLKTTDLSGGMAEKLEGHLKSDDFFGVGNYPTATFDITDVASRGKAGEYRVTGDLTIKGTTKPVKFNTTVIEEMGKYVAVAEVKIDRTEYNVRYGSGSFFDNLGDKTIYDEFDLGIRLVTAK